MTGSRGWICPVVADAARLIIFLYFAGLSCATAMQRFDAHSKRRLIPEVELYPIFQNPIRIRHAAARHLEQTQRGMFNVTRR